MPRAPADVGPLHPASPMPGCKTDKEERACRDRLCVRGNAEKQACSPPDACVQDDRRAMAVQRAAARPAAGCIIGGGARLQRDRLMAPRHQVTAGGVRPAAGPVPLAAAQHVLVEAACMHAASA